MRRALRRTGQAKASWSVHMGESQAEIEASLTAYRNLQWAANDLEDNFGAEKSKVCDLEAR